MKKRKPLPPNLEDYHVRFWYRKDDGYAAQMDEYYKAPGKNGHDKAARQCEKKYGSRLIKIVHVTYV